MGGNSRRINDQVEQVIFGDKILSVGEADFRFFSDIKRKLLVRSYSSLEGI